MKKILVNERVIFQLSRYGIFIFAVALLLLSSCKKKSPEFDFGLNQKLNFNSEEYHSYINNYFNDLVSEKEAAKFNFHYLDTLRHLYSSRNFEPLFVKSFEEKSFVDSLLDIFNKANEHGLNPEYYHFTNIKDEFFNSIKDSTEKQERYEHLANTELLVCDAVLRYAYHLRYGVVNPKEILLDSYNIPVPDSSSRNLLEPLKQTNVIRYLFNIQPKSKKYLNLQKALRQFENYKDKSWEKIIFHAQKIKRGDFDSVLIHVAERLTVLGFIDTSIIQFNNYTVYDSVLEAAVKNFQAANGLIDDGVISKNSVDKLNVTPQEYINKIKVNLERFRWIDYSDSATYLLVNIPEFKLHAYENGEEKFEIKVCTGRRRSVYVHQQLKALKDPKAKKPRVEDWETPVLYSQLSHLILNPTWTVPFSIMREEIATKVRRDSAYLKKANFRVYKDGSQIDPAQVKLSELSSGNIPYTIIQNPGAGNALGKIKFMFNNPFGVYLHDTPTRPPFSYANRAVSHGCVRVEKPFLLAEYLLANNSNWSVDYVKIETGSKVDDKNVIEEFRQKRNELRKGFSYGQTTEVKLENKIPLFIDYYTAWVDKNGVVNFRDDVYRQDEMISEHLFAGKN